ncbi:MAG: exo-beta-N-acetylmuramidase NamZ domain-containing protein, partial [Ignavibacteriaceae bacterium]
MNYKLFLIAFLFLQTIFCQSNKVKIATGADLLLSENIDLVEGQNLGIITNHTALLSNGTHLVDALYNSEFRIKIVALFGPEHGIRGQAKAGEVIENGIDEKTQAPIYSLYGKNKKPTKEMLKGVNVLI